MAKQAIKNTFLPELGNPYSGKVRDIYENGKTLTMITSDRISVFDCILPNAIPEKGQVLNQTSLFWFDHTKDIIDNHILMNPDPNVLVVKKCTPIPIEVIVRGFIVGSLWRDYEKGKREKCGIKLPEGLKQNDQLQNPILTPTTKSHHGHDEDISKEEILKRGIVSKDLWQKIESTAFKLYRRGQDIAQKNGLILVDTKYEFGLDENKNLVLIDEVHTPDSSRYWVTQEGKIKDFTFPDKEFARQWASSQGFTGHGVPPFIPIDIAEKIQEGYRKVYEKITGKALLTDSRPTSKRILENLKKANIVKGVFTLILAGSEKDQEHIDKITAVLNEHAIPTKTIVGSAHKNPRLVADIIDQYNQSAEPVVCIAVAGRSNALSGVVAANLKWPTIACPPFKDHSDYLVNIHSSLQMPSLVPALTVIDPKNAALAAIKILTAMEASA